jgi:hypothetical protein
VAGAFDGGGFGVEGDFLKITLVIEMLTDGNSLSKYTQMLKGILLLPCWKSAG